MYVDLIAKQMERKENLNVEIAVTGGATLSPNLVHQMYDILNAKKINVNLKIVLKTEYFFKFDFSLFTVCLKPLVLSFNQVLETRVPKVP